MLRIRRGRSPPPATGPGRRRQPITTLHVAESRPAPPARQVSCNSFSIPSSLSSALPCRSLSPPREASAAIPFPSASKTAAAQIHTRADTDRQNRRSGFQIPGRISSLAERGSPPVLAERRSRLRIRRRPAEPVSERASWAVTGGGGHGEQHIPVPVRAVRAVVGGARAPRRAPRRRRARPRHPQLRGQLAGSGPAEPPRRLLQESAGELVQEAAGGMEESPAAAQDARGSCALRCADAQEPSESRCRGLLGFLWPATSKCGSKHPAAPPPPKPQGAKFELHTLPIDPKSVADGDTINVYVDTADPRESGSVPREVQKAAAERTKARAAKNYQKADALQKVIVDAGYRPVPNARGEEVLAKKYRIRLRGIDAPESAMPYGKEAKEALLKLVQGKSLKVYVYDQDRYGRCVGDIYCDGVFVQEQMLKKGFAWHYTAYDQRPELAKWEKQAQTGRKGLWASSKPQKPWEWRKDKRNGTA
ncbi:unnamed protein product [Urochloa decumbens]|uniref:TNase-like domain-containing protein n=1 Tax=Urochloa decumbens TaxID=240449 RepID=A0ABC8ZAA6_9POAL